MDKTISPIWPDSSAAWAQAAADKARDEAHAAHARLERIEAALVKAGLMEAPPPEPEPDRRSFSQVLKEHYAKAFEKFVADGHEFPPLPAQGPRG